MAETPWRVASTGAAGLAASPGAAVSAAPAAASLAARLRWYQARYFRCAGVAGSSSKCRPLPAIAAMVDCSCSSGSSQRGLRLLIRPVHTTGDSPARIQGWCSPACGPRHAQRGAYWLGPLRRTEARRSRGGKRASLRASAFVARGPGVGGAA